MRVWGVGGGVVRLFHRGGALGTHGAPPPRWSAGVRDRASGVGVERREWG